MTATSFPARHEAIRAVLIERGWKHQFTCNGTHQGWARGLYTLAVPVHLSVNYDKECEQVEVLLGLSPLPEEQCLPLRLPPEVQRAVDAERARCVAILRAAIKREINVFAYGDVHALRLRAEVHEHAAEKLRELLTKIESGEAVT